MYNMHVHNESLVQLYEYYLWVIINNIQKYKFIIDQRYNSRKYINYFGAM